MRLIEARLSDVNVYRATENASTYIGKVKVWTLHGTLRADVQPQVDRLTREKYGQRAEKMKTLYAPFGSDVVSGDGLFSLSSGKPEYLAVEVLSYPTHVVITAERQQ